MSHIQHFPRFFVLLLALWLVGLPLAAQAETGPREGLLIVAFGTSVPEAVPALKALDADVRAAFPKAAVEWAYTSQIIRKKLAERGTPVGGISEGLAALARKGVKVVRVQSLHVMAGEEFSALERAVLLDVKAHPGRFDAVYLGRPLLESRRDAREVAAAVLESCGGRAPGEGLVLMGHGQAHGRADLVFEGMRRAFVEADGLTFMASVEGACRPQAGNALAAALHDRGRRPCPQRPCRRGRGQLGFPTAQAGLSGEDQPVGHGRDRRRPGRAHPACPRNEG